MDSTTRDEEKTSAQLDLFGERTAEPAVSEQIQDRSEAGSAVDEVVRTALDYLNDVTERTGAARFTSAKSIKERIRDGATLDDFVLVIDFCHAMWWGDPKMETFVRPKTLFGKENFPEYLVRARKWQDEGRPSLLRGAARQGAGERSIDMYSAHVKGGEK
ncbi:MAG: conserved phage C-terminal domain-containing protein [Candidatus Bipolaricaulia bacterium]